MPATHSSNSHRDPEFWNNHICKWEASGLSQAEYCNKNGLKVSQLAYQRKKRQRPRAGRSDAKLIKATLTKPSVSPFRVILSDQVIVECPTVQQTIDLISQVSVR